jgi:penicillin-binding protein A
MKLKKRIDDHSLLPKAGWREYQAQLNRARKRRRALKQLPRIVGVVLMAVAVVYWVFFHRDETDANLTTRTPVVEERVQPATVVFTKPDIRTILAGQPLDDLTSPSITFSHNGKNYRAETSIDKALQSYLTDKLDTRHSMYIGIVALEPNSGRVLAMVSYDKEAPTENMCVAGRFPAASIFKIVTAAAAIEDARLKPNSNLSYNGRKHTLYKSQINEKHNRYTHSISLEDSFAQSINPVFGKLGTLTLGKDTLEKYGAAFGFNREIPFEITVEPSILIIDDEPYNWAEIASGFNRETLISPLHGALIGAVALNQGEIPEPSFVDKIFDEQQQVIYTAPLVPLTRAVDARASEYLRQMMITTVQSGTARKAFRGHGKAEVLSKLNIGGKTGSINNNPRYDWFVGFAQEKEGTTGMIISVVVAHHNYIGTRAGQYARMTFKKYFGDQFEKSENIITGKDPHTSIATIENYPKQP